MIDFPKQTYHSVLCLTFNGLFFFLLAFLSLHRLIAGVEFKFQRCKNVDGQNRANAILKSLGVYVRRLIWVRAAFPTCSKLKMISPLCSTLFFCFFSVSIRFFNYLSLYIYMHIQWLLIGV